MEIQIDTTRNVAYLKFSDESKQVRTIEISDDILVDVDGEGIVQGVELLNASQQLGQSGISNLRLINRISGNRIDVELPV